MQFTEKHYKPFIKGMLCKKWSGFLPVNYGNEKSNPKGKQTNIYSTDTTKGCSNKCIGCYGARLCVISGKNFGWVKNVTLRGKVKGKAFLWTTAPNPIPDSILRSNIGVNVTIDPMRSIRFINRAMKAIKALGPKRTVLVFKVYPGNDESARRCLAIAKALRNKGFRRMIQVVVRLFSHKQAKKANCVICPKDKHDRKLFYKAYSVKGLGLVCGSLGDGKCIDCMYCYKAHKAVYRIGTSADPMDRPEHTEGELIRLGFI